MNRNKLKAYAPQARRDFIKAVTDRAAYYGLIKDEIQPITEQGDVAIIAGKPFPRSVAKKRKSLEERVRQQGLEQVMEAMAYTWFNRFVAIRFMELHGYLDHGYRVLSHPEGTATPEILEHAEHMDLPGLDREKVIELKLEGTKESELYCMLLIAQCNALHRAMPFLFEWIGDATELLLPENLLHSDSLIRKLVNEIPEDEWQEVEIIGWLYQFYISEKKDQVIGKVVKSEDIPAATQLFTPNWIVKYMVQNTLGRQWIATYPNSPLKQQMEYYIEPTQQTPEVQEQLKAITPESLNPEELTLLDPACGSGHILVEAYQLLKSIYQERGYRAKDIPRLILEKNLYGLEIDDRAAQLAAFALMMKARADDRRIFDNGAKPHVFAIQESKKLDAEKITIALNAPILKSELLPREMLFEEMNEARAPLFSRKNLSIKGEVAVADVTQLIDLFEHGKTFGSLIRVPDELARKLAGIMERVEDVLAHGDMFGKAAANAMMPIVKQAQVLAGKYDEVVTNPPYMGTKGMNAAVKAFAQNNYPDSKSDLFAMFIERGLEMVPNQGYSAMVTMQSWMFLSSYEKLRQRLLAQASVECMLHMANMVMGIAFGTAATVWRNAVDLNPKGAFCYVEYEDIGDGNKPVAFPPQNERNKAAPISSLTSSFFRASAADFKKIPGCPIAYWVSDTVSEIFQNEKKLEEIAPVKVGLQTGNNEIFVREWFEVSSDKTSFCSKGNHDFSRKWFPYNKGGGYRKWYGNNENIVHWENDGNEIRNFTDGKGKLRSRPQNRDYYFRESISWSFVSSSYFGVRFSDTKAIFDVGGSSAFPSEDDKYFLVGLLCSVVSHQFMKAMNPTLNFQVGNVASIPVISKKKISFDESLVKVLISAHKADWDSYETSWAFTHLPLLHPNCRQLTLKAAYTQLRAHWRNMTLEMQRIEEENNRIFIEAYGLEDELTSEVPLKEITLTCNPHYRYGGDRSEGELEALLLADTMKELVSYSIGCMMGRYSLDKPGLIYAHSGNVDFDPSQYKTFPADQDGIIPVTDIDWFADDAGNRFIQFISVPWARQHLEANLTFIAESLGQNSGESPRETIRSYLATGFYKHHMTMYKRRPIYWLFSSGKQRALQSLVYLHRYNEATLSRIRTEYVIPLQGKINARIDQLKDDIRAAASTSHRKKLEKEREKLIMQQTELHAFDEKLRHYADQRISLDLDDGVKVNYGKFGDLLAEVKAITGKEPD